MSDYEQLEVAEPTHRLITSIGWIEADWGNANLIRHYDPYENYLEYNDGDNLHQLNVLDRDWEALLAAEFPWEYWPDMSQFTDEDFIKVQVAKDAYALRPSNTKLRVFADSDFNHVEHQPDPGNPANVRGITVIDTLWRMLFKGDFPIKFLPYVDEDTRKWAKKMGLCE